MSNDFTAQIRDFKNGELDQIERKWDLYVINPYSLAYHRAYDKFKAVLEDQAKFDKMKMDLMLTGISLFGGTLFTAAFGETTTKALAGQIVVDQLNRSNNIRTLKLAGFLDNNVAAQFTIGELWTRSQKEISDRVKNLFQPNPKNFPEAKTIVQKPYEIDIALKQFRLNCAVKLYEVLKDLVQSDLTDRDKAILFARARNSHFCNPPSSNEFPAELKDKIELSFWMKYILDTDFVLGLKIDGEVVPMPLHGKPISINVSPMSKAYPKDRFHVQYRKVGQIIIDRINKLFKEHYGYKWPFIDSDYFGEHTSHTILQRAELVLKDLAKYVTPRVGQLRQSKAA